MKPVVLRPLEWVASPHGDQFDARTVVGRYSALVNWRGEVIWCSNTAMPQGMESVLKRGCATLDEAKAAAEKDYMERIAPFLLKEEDNAGAE